MFNIGPWELILILLIALLLFGPKRLPEIGKAIGRTFSELKKSIEGRSETKEEKNKEENLSDI